MPISFDWSAPLNASGVSPSAWNSNPPCTGRHAEMTLIHGPAGANSCPYRVPCASCVASVSPVKRVFVIASGGAGIRTRSVASAYTSPNTGTGPDRDTCSAVKLVRRQSGSERQSQSGALQRSADQRHQQLPEPPKHVVLRSGAARNGWCGGHRYRTCRFLRRAVTARSNPGLRIPANGSTTIRTRWCSSSSAAHTAQTNFNGTDANGRVWSVTGTTVRLLAK
jgi:hypothetical protein